MNQKFSTSLWIFLLFVEIVIFYIATQESSFYLIEEYPQDKIVYFFFNIFKEYAPFFKKVAISITLLLLLGIFIVKINTFTSIFYKKLAVVTLLSITIVFIVGFSYCVDKEVLLLCPLYSNRALAFLFYPALFASFILFRVRKK